MDICADPRLEPWQRQSLLRPYTHAWCAFHPMEFTPATAAQTAAANDHLSRCCMAGGALLVHVKRMLERLHAARSRTLEDHYIQGNLNVAHSQPLVQDSVFKALIAADRELECKTYWLGDKDVHPAARGTADPELTDRLTVLGLSSETDSWNECLPPEWCGDMKLTFPFDSLWDLLMVDPNLYSQITDYYIGVDESYDL